MIVLMAPFGLETSVIQLRNPDFSDGKDRILKSTVKISMDGSLKTFRKTPTFTRFTWTFSELTRAKVIELENFVKAHIGQEIRVIDMDEQQWKMKFVNNVQEFSTPSRGLGATELKEAGTATLVLEGDMI